MKVRLIRRGKLQRRRGLPVVSVHGKTAPALQLAASDQSDFHDVFTLSHFPNHKGRPVLVYRHIDSTVSDNAWQRREIRLRIARCVYFVVEYLTSTSSRMFAFRTGKLCSFYVNIADCATVSELEKKILPRNQNFVVGVDEHQPRSRSLISPHLIGRN